MADRRAFLSGLVSLPLIGGRVTLIGKPTAAAVPITPELLNGYKAFLVHEHWMLSHELAGHDKQRAETIHRTFYSDHPGWEWWKQGPRSSPGTPEPSTRAAVVLSAVGCRLEDPTPPGPFFR